MTDKRRILNINGRKYLRQDLTTVGEMINFLLDESLVEKYVVTGILTPLKSKKNEKKK